MHLLRVHILIVAVAVMLSRFVQSLSSRVRAPVRLAKSLCAVASPSDPEAPKKRIRIKRTPSVSAPDAATGSAASFGSSGAGSSGSSTGDEGFVTINFGSEALSSSVDMDERIKDAKGWVGKQLTDDEADILNRAMGIEEEVRAAEEGRAPRQLTKAKAGKLSKGKQQGSGGRSGAVDAAYEDGRALAKMRGFLQLNPYTCPGCGAPFQAKQADTPGYLPREQLSVHRKQADSLRRQQDAVRVLDAAGLDVSSKAAEELLRDAGIAQETIEGVQRLGRTLGENPSDQQASHIDVNGDDDENEMYGDEDVDVLDGMEVDLSDMVAALEAGGVAAGDDVASTMVKGIAKQAAAAAAAASTPVSAAAPAAVARSECTTYINDISAELGQQPTPAYVNANLPMPVPRTKKAYPVVGTGKSADGNTSASDTADDSVRVCQRCYRLQAYGQVENSLRPGWSEHELLTPAHFKNLLSEIKETRCVVLCLVDLFDLEGSILTDLRAIAGSNPVLIAANKVDLLPKDAPHDRLKGFLHSDIKELCGFMTPKEKAEAQRQEYEKRGWVRHSEKDNDVGVLRRNNIHLVSCSTGQGIRDLVDSAVAMAKDNGEQIYVMGAANVGKSSFINQLLEHSYDAKKSGNGKRGGTKSKSKSSPKKTTASATVSNLPGTTLNFLKIMLPNGITMYDTPGLLNEGQLTAKLTTEELRQVIPVTPIMPVTFRVLEGKTVLVGGLASVELLEGRPFFITFFFSNEIKLHPTDTSRVQEFLDKHTGKLVTPPSSPERREAIGPFESFDFDCEGHSWHRASCDIVFAGLGWVSITGTGPCKIRVTAPKGTGITQRPPLLPYESKHSTAKFSGGRIVKKSKKNKAGSYGWRA